MTLPTGLRGQLVALGILLIMLIVVAQFAIAPLWSAYIDKQDEITDMRRDIDRYRQLIAQAPELEALTERDRREQPLAPLLLPGSNPALAAAELQQWLQELAAGLEVRVLSMRVRSTERDGAFERIAIEARMQSKMPGLRDLLNEIEQGTPYLFVDTLSVRSRPQRRRGAPSTAALEARLVVSGLRLATPTGGGPLTADALR